MFKAGTIDRFRGFRKLRVANLERFNLFLGRNNVGKTAFLEALFLLMGPTNPHLPLRLAALRGIEKFQTDPDDLWGWLFYAKDMTTPIFLEASLLGNKSRTLQISLGEPKEQVRRGKMTAQIRSAVSTSSTDMPLSELVLKYRDEHGTRITAKASIRDDAIAFHRGNKPVKLPTGIMIGARVGYAPENSGRFSKLEVVGRGDDLLPALRILEPRMKKLAVLVTGSGPIIHGDIGIGRMVPLPMMGEGTGRLLTLLLAVHDAAGGAVLIDEVDSGFHYSALPSVWTALSETARAENVQIFCTSHSWECLKAAHESFCGSADYDFRLHRLDRLDGEIRDTDFDKDMIETALMSGLELR